MTVPKFANLKQKKCCQDVKKDAKNMDLDPTCEKNAYSDPDP